MNDEQLMRQYQAGSEEAFMLLYEKYSSLVFSFIVKRLRQSEAEDFYQKVWRRLHEKRGLYKDQPFAPWFFVMIRHLLIDEYRSLGSRKELTTEFFVRTAMDSAMVEGPDVEELLRSLPQETAELVRSHYLDEKSYEDLSKILGITESTIRQRLSRGIKGIRAKVKGME